VGLAYRPDDKLREIHYATVRFADGFRFALLILRSRHAAEGVFVGFGSLKPPCKLRRRRNVGVKIRDVIILILRSRQWAQTQKLSGPITRLIPGWVAQRFLLAAIIVMRGKHARRRTSDAYWRAPYNWNDKALQFERTHGRRQRVFCASLADVFDNQASAKWRTELFKLICACDRLDWLLLTKRPENIAKMLPPDWGNGYSNVWLGMTAENQKHYDQRWRHLRRINCAITFVSYEPAIGPLRLRADDRQPDWLISGGESGGSARTMNPQWARDIISDCREFGVAPFHKQWGTYASNPLVFEDGLSPKKAQLKDDEGKGGGLVDGSIVREFPSTPHFL
jgi:protein gp37